MCKFRQQMKQKLHVVEKNVIVMVLILKAVFRKTADNVGINNLHEFHLSDSSAVRQ